MEPFPQDSRSSTSILICHWGRRGAGPKISLELLKAMGGCRGVKALFSVSKDAHIYEEFLKTGLCHWDVSTIGGRLATLANVLSLPARMVGFRRFLRRNNVAIAITPMGHVWEPFCTWALKCEGASHFLFVHDACPHKGDEAGSLYHRLVRHDARLADGVVFHSEYVRKRFSEICSLRIDRTLVLPHGPFLFGNAAPSPRVFPRPEPRLLCFGRIRDYKGFDLAVDAMPEIARRFPGAKLRIAGGGSSAELRRRIDEVGSHLVQFDDGFIAESGIGDLIRESDVLVAPYREASQSGVVASAQAMGLPVVCTQVGGLPEQVVDGQTGVLASAITSTAIAEAAIRLLSDKELYRRCAATAHARMQSEWSWETSSQRLLEFCWQVREREHN